MKKEAVVKLGVISILSVCIINCGGGGGKGSGGGGNVGGGSGSSSSAPIKSYTIQVQDGDVLKSYTVQDGADLQHQLDSAYTDLDVVSVSGCGQTLSSVQHRFGVRDIQWHPKSDCSLEIVYDRKLAKGNFVTLNVTGYGSRLSTLGVDYIFVSEGEGLRLPLGLREGYTATALGCDGRIDDDRYVIDSVTESCDVDLLVNPINVDRARSVTVNYSGEIGGISGSEVLLVAEWTPVEIKMGNSLGFVPSIDTDCGNGNLREDWGLPNARLVFNNIAPESCTVNVSYSIAEGRALVAYAAPSDQYRTYVSSTLYNSALVKGTHIALSPSEDGVIFILPNPGFSVSNVEGCKADNDQISIYMRTAYLAANFGNAAHGVSDCAVIVDAVEDLSPVASNVEIVFAWDRPSDPKAGNVTLLRLTNAWQVVDVKQLGVNGSVSIGSPEFPSNIGGCGTVAFDNDGFFIMPGIGRNATCGVELKKR